jgi:small subunit ribosomal protein S4
VTVATVHGEGAENLNFTGAKVKKSRALGVALTPKAQRIMRKRPNPPGQHGEQGQKRRRRPSAYAVQLLEKQRLRFQYSVTESYLRKTFVIAGKAPGATGEALVQLLETRLDALVLRAGFAPSIYAARQYVTHGHFEVNGHKATIPSMRLKVGDVIAVRERSKSMVMFNELKTTMPVLPYLVVDDSKMSARFDYMPTRYEIPVICDEHLVVEFYSR